MPKDRRIKVSETLHNEFKEASSNSPFGNLKASAEEALRMFNKKYGGK